MINLIRVLLLVWPGRHQPSLASTVHRVQQILIVLRRSLFINYPPRQGKTVQGGGGDDSFDDGVWRIEIETLDRLTQTVSLDTTRIGFKN